VVNLTLGRLSDTGIVHSSPASLDALIGHIDAWAITQTNPRVMFFAHGGLVSEKRALYDIVLLQAQWWMRNGVYPVFFVWETGLFEVLGRQVQLDNAERGLKEVIIESTFGRIGRDAWDEMKASAEYASQAAIAGGTQGGGLIFAEKFIAWLAKPATPVLSLHAVGHSAGSIFLGYWLPMFIEKAKRAKFKKPITTLSLLAPACTTAFFKEKLLPPIQANEIAALAEFTMTVAAERADTLIGIYKGSLLYFVRNACERNCPPLLGLEESVRGDAELINFFALDGGAPQADMVFSPTATSTGRFATQALTHGDFDNDPATMNSVLRRILSLADDIALPDAMTAQDTTRAVVESPARGVVGAGTFARSSSQVLALCIGIDDYPDKPLTGCVADAKLWAETLESRGAIIHSTLFNATATKRGIIDAWKSVCIRAQSGDTVVIQYAGHGTQVPDRSGDENIDGLDEAWVPYDYAAGHALIDDEIGGLIDAHTPAGVRLVLITDCCNSASNTRAKPAGLGANARSRLLPLKDNHAFVEKFKKTNARWSRELSARGKGEPEREIHFAGCQDEQSSFESNGHGAFTLAAVAALNALAAGGCYRDWDRAIREKFVANGPQVPNFKALPTDAQRAVFSNESAAHGGPGSQGSELAQVLSKIAALEAKVAEINATLDRLV
jgi:Caspase domain